MHIKRVMVKEVGQLSSLSELAQPVKELSYSGHFLELLNQPLVAIVGSRKVTPYGIAVTKKLSSDLARAGVVIVSGLALGVDSIAHQAALDAGGKTLAVLPTGLDKIYPATHYSLSHRITAGGGALVSEYPEGSGSPQKFQFIARNRIIAGLSQGVLITEAAAKSGSLHTADFALEQGIEVFAIPGNITSTFSEGTNNLIKSGATPVTSAQDILETLGITSTEREAYQPANDIEELVLTYIRQTPLSSSELLARSDLEPNITNQTLTLLEIKGVIQTNSVGAWIIS